MPTRTKKNSPRELGKLIKFPRPPVRVYADTSVFGGAFDDLFRPASLAFFDRVEKGDFILIVSEVTRREIFTAPSNVVRFFENFAARAVIAEVSPDSLLLRKAYLDAGILTQKSAEDALHVALTTVSDCSLIVSWNFKHIVHFQKIPLFNAINVLHGFKTIAIHSPQEVISND